MSTLEGNPGHYAATRPWPTRRHDVQAVGQVLDALARCDLWDTMAIRGAWCFQFWIGCMPRLTRGLDLALISPRAALPVKDALARLGGPDIRVDASSLRDSGQGWTARTIGDVRVRCGGSWVPLRILIAHNVADLQHTEWLRAPTTSLDGATQAVPCLTREWMVAEKAALMVTYGPDHTRLQDVFDIWVLQRLAHFDASVLATAIRRVFGGRDATRMLLRHDGYWEAALDRQRLGRQHLTSWEAIVAGATCANPVPSLPDVLDEVAGFLLPILRERRQLRSPASWDARTGWVRKSDNGRRTATSQPSLLQWQRMDRTTRAQQVAERVRRTDRVSFAQRGNAP